MVETTGSQWTALAPLLNFHSQLSSPIHVLPGIEIRRLTDYDAPEYDPSSLLPHMLSQLDSFPKGMGFQWILEGRGFSLDLPKFFRATQSSMPSLGPSIHYTC